MGRFDRIMTVKDYPIKMRTAGAGLRVCMPGVFAGCAEQIRDSFVRAEPAALLSFLPFRPTGLLASDILGGAEADVFVSANWQYMDDLRRAGLVHEPRVIARNRLCIVVAAEHGGTIAGLADLAKPGVRVV